VIITELYDGQGLGNQLWVYAVSRSIAEQLKTPFVLIGAERFKGKGFLNIASELGISKVEADEMRVSARWKLFHEALYYDQELDYISSDYDPRVLTLSGAYKLDGLFQSEKYFFDEIERPKKYFLLDEVVKSRNMISNDTCIINLRGGEYKRHKNFILPELYWETAIKNMKRMTDVRKFLVVTDDVRYARAIFPGYEVLTGQIGDCYASIYNAKYLILSNSSFAYFPVKTGGNSQLVIAPKYWARYANTYKRWASAANLYKSWLWQTPEGRLSTFEECLPECEENVAEYEAKCIIRVSPDQVVKHGIRQYVPTWLRRDVKRALSLILPRHFG
jgi:hypothetical protein